MREPEARTVSPSFCIRQVSQLGEVKTKATGVDATQRRKEKIGRNGWPLKEANVLQSDKKRLRELKNPLLKSKEEK
jgi:hypothetical protein